MQRIIQINIGGRLIPIEDEAYTALKNYLNTLHHQFAHDSGKDEIINDIESRISELFQMRLDTHIAVITMTDVGMVMTKLGAAHQLGADDATYKASGLPVKKSPAQSKASRKLYRNPQEKKIAGVCSGLADYFSIDPTIVRLIFFLAAFLALGGLITYVVCWIILPVATPEDIAVTKGGKIDYDRIKNNVVTDLNDLKARAEKMTVELKEWFSKQKW